MRPGLGVGLLDRSGLRPAWSEIRALSVARLPYLLLGVAVVACAVLVLWLGRDLTFFRDEWYFVAYRDGSTIDSWLAPHAGHNQLVPVALYLFLFDRVGLDNYLPFRVMGLTAHIACAGLLYLFARRRIGEAAAVAPAVLLLFLGPGWMDIVWPFQIGFLIALAAGLGMLLALEWRNQHADRWAAVCLFVALFSSGLGPAFAVAAAVNWAMRPNRLRRIHFWVVPVIAWGVWYGAFGSQASQLKSGNITRTPGYVFDAAGAAAGAMSGLGAPVGQLLILALLVVLARRYLASDGLTVETWTILSAGTTFWVLTALARAHEGEPGASRYVYVGSVFVILAVLELARGIRFRPKALALLAGATAVALTTNLGLLVKGAEDPAQRSGQVAAVLGALEIARGQVDPGFDVGQTTGGAAPIQAGFYLAAAKRWKSSPADGEGEILRRSENMRRRADRTLMLALDFLLVPRANLPLLGGTLEAVRVSDGDVAERGRCLTFEPEAQGGKIDVPSPPGGVGIVLAPGAEARILTRRFAKGFDRRSALSPVAGGSTSVLRIPSDRSTRPWALRFITSQRLRLCPLRVPGQPFRRSGPVR